MRNNTRKTDQTFLIVSATVQYHEYGYATEEERYVHMSGMACGRFLERETGLPFLPFKKVAVVEGFVFVSREHP